MRKRLVLSAAALSAVALAMPAALASPAPATLDGKKTTTLTLKASAPMQDHDETFVTEQVIKNDRMQCKSDRCAVLPFVYKPANGVKGDVAFTLTWGTPGSDFDLYVVSIDKSGERADIGHCGGSIGTSEKVFLSADNFKPGKTYGLLADFYRTPGEQITGTVAMPGTNSVATTVPSAADSLQPVNCNL
jgi:hypothetical protein